VAFYLAANEFIYQAQTRTWTGIKNAALKKTIFKAGTGAKYRQAVRDDMSCRHTGKTDQDARINCLFSSPMPWRLILGDRFDVILTNPPFGKKAAPTVVAKDGKVARKKTLLNAMTFARPPQ